MKHPDFYEMALSVQRLEIEALTQAVKAHGGSFEFTDDSNLIYVPISLKDEPEPFDTVVTKVYIEDDQLCVEGYKKEDDEPIDFDLTEIYVGWISLAILENIPDIKDTTEITLTRAETGVYTLVQHPMDTSYFEENNIGYPSADYQNSQARYVHESDYLYVFGMQPDEDILFKPVCWPQSQDLFDDPTYQTYTELIQDEKGLKDFGPSAYWVPLGVL